MSVQQASRFIGDVLCLGPFEGIDSKGAVDSGDTSSGLIDPNQYAKEHENTIAATNQPLSWQLLEDLYKR